MATITQDMDRYVHPREDKKQEAIKKVGLLLQG